MGAYITWEDNLKPSLSNETANRILMAYDNDAEKLNTNAILTAESEIDSYLGMVLDSVPLSEPPAIVKRLAINMSMYYVHTKLQFIDIPEHIQKGYDLSIRTLEKISKKEIALFNPKDGGEAPIEDASWGNDSGLLFDDGIFSRDSF